MLILTFQVPIKWLNLNLQPFPVQHSFSLSPCQFYFHFILFILYFYSPLFTLHFHPPPLLSINRNSATQRHLKLPAPCPIWPYLAAKGPLKDSLCERAVDASQQFAGCTRRTMAMGHGIWMQMHMQVGAESCFHPFSCHLSVRVFAALGQRQEEENAF